MISADDAFKYQEAQFVDASWSMDPAQNVTHKQNWQTARIRDAVFFDLEQVSDPLSPLPHMLPSALQFSAQMGALGLTHARPIIVYDQTGISFAAARVWWMFRVFGHKDVHVLDGGLKAWTHPLNANPPTQMTPTTFNAIYEAAYVATKQDVQSALSSLDVSIIDARAQNRFLGLVDEPRAGLRRGNIPTSKNVPFSDVQENGFLKKPAELEALFKNILKQKAITSCGSGVTACTLALALDQIGKTDVAVYDGSWAEWGQIE